MYSCTSTKECIIQSLLKIIYNNGNSFYFDDENKENLSLYCQNTTTYNDKDINECIDLIEKNQNEIDDYDPYTEYDVCLDGKTINNITKAKYILMIDYIRLNDVSSIYGGCH